jgi:hypothetical protein
MTRLVTAILGVLALVRIVSGSPVERFRRGE